MNLKQTSAEDLIYRKNIKRSICSLLHMLANEELSLEGIPALLEYFSKYPHFKELSNIAASRMVTAKRI